MPIVHLSDRGVVKVGGETAAGFLDGLFTCDIDRVTPRTPRLGALLSPQGKILFDFIVFRAPPEDGGDFYLDVARPFAADLAKRLTFYRLRAKVTIEDRSDMLAVIAGFDAPAPADEVGLVATDPRLPDLGWRAIIAAQDVPEFAREPAEAWHAHRIALGIPEGGKDFLFGDAFPHEAMMDQLHGVDFDKGCYVGQEVVSRMQHRGTARTRILPVIYPEGFGPEPGAPVTAGDRALGTAGTSMNGRGLVLVRVDRVADALAAGEPILSGGHAVTLEKPAWWRLPFPGEMPASA